MKVTFQHAIVSFCSDLTDPNGQSVPLGALLVGEAGSYRFAAAAGLVPEGGVGLDPLSMDLLSDVPNLLKRHINEVFASAPPDVTLDSVLFSLHDSLRNSLHVAQICESETVELDIEDVEELSDVARQQLAAEMIRRVCQALDNQIRTAFERGLWTVVPAPQRSEGAPPKHARPEMSACSFWPLHRREAERELRV